MHNNKEENKFIKANIVCPYCSNSYLEYIPKDQCVYFYRCKKCFKILKPKEGDCCVFCSYSDKKCYYFKF